MEAQSLPLNVRIEKISEKRMSIEIGTKLKAQNTVRESFTPIYEYKIDPRFFAIEIIEKLRNEVLLQSSRGALIASSTYFEWSFYLGTTKLYGLGEYEIIDKPIKKLLLRNGKAENNFLPIIIARVTSNNSMGHLF